MTDQTNAYATPSSPSFLGWALFGVVALAPIPLGSDRPLSAALLALCVGLLLLLWAGTCLWNPGRFASLPTNFTWAILLFAIVVVWILLQTAPFLPHSFHHPAYDMFSSVTGAPANGAISPNRGATLFALMRLLSYAGILWLSFQVTQGNLRPATILTWIARVGAIYALYAIIIFLIGNASVAFWPKVAYPDNLTGTFINRNTAATFFGIMLLCQTATLRRAATSIFSSSLSTRDKILEFAQKLLVKRRLEILSWLLIATALLLTGSRGGVLSSVAGIIVFSLLPISRRNSRSSPLRRRMIVLTGILLLGTLLYEMSGGVLQQRFQTIDTAFSDEGRLSAYRLELNAIATAPLIGQGYGTFQYVFPAYKDDTLADITHWDMAHDTYLELALELGLPAFAALAGAVFLLILRTAQVYRRQRRLISALALGVFTLVGMHALVDFSLQIPAIASLVALLAGMALGVPSRSRVLRPQPI